MTDAMPVTTAGPLTRLAPADEANLVLDQPGQVNAFLVAGLASEGGFLAADGSVDIEMLRAHVGARIPALRPLRQIPVGAGRRHRWADAAPDLDHHVRVVAAVDGRAGLERLCGDLMSIPIPRDRPMWELLIAPGATVGGVGLVLRIHHAIADGMAAVAIAQELFDGGEQPASVPIALRPVAHPDALKDLMGLAGRLARRMRRVRTIFGSRGVGQTVLLGERGPQRGIAFLSADLAALEEHARPVGATVNDSLLAAAAAGYRAALAAAGEDVPAELPVSVPVALPRRGTSGNQVGVMLVLLPLGEPDPDERLRLISARTRSEKISARSDGTLEFMRGPWGAGILDRIAHHQHVVAGFVTNVPGPTESLRLAGAPVAAIWPVTALAGNVRLGVAAISYAGRLGCSVHFDRTRVPGVEFSLAMADELARLSSGRPALSA